MSYLVKRGRWAGVRLNVGRVPRQRIDDFVSQHPEPDPPRKKAADLGIEVWGDPDEEVPDHTDAGYQEARREWELRFSHEMVGLLSTVVELAQGQPEVEREIGEMRVLGLASGEATMLLLSSLGRDDLREIVELILYNSTVTLRGLVEAARSYNVRWRGRKVAVAGKVSGPAQASSVFEARIAARWAHYRWSEFCELSGPEQSEVVALRRYENKLESLMANNKRRGV